MRSLRGFERPDKRRELLEYQASLVKITHQEAIDSHRDRFLVSMGFTFVVACWALTVAKAL